MMAGSWLGHKEVKRENILGKGRRSKKFGGIWLELKCKPNSHIHKDHALLDSAFYPKPRVEPLKGLKESEIKLLWLLEIRWIRIQTGTLYFLVSGWVRKQGGLNQRDSSKMGEADRIQMKM